VGLIDGDTVQPQRLLLTGGEMVALAFVLCLIIYATSFWLAFGELERRQVGLGANREAQVLA
jgi:hypothetical protein